MQFQYPLLLTFGPFIAYAPEGGGHYSSTCLLQSRKELRAPLMDVFYLHMFLKTLFDSQRVIVFEVTSMEKYNITLYRSNSTDNFRK